MSLPTTPMALTPTGFGMFAAPGSAARICSKGLSGNSDSSSAKRRPQAGDAALVEAQNGESVAVRRLGDGDEDRSPAVRQVRVHVVVSAAVQECLRQPVGRRIGGTAGCTARDVTGEVQLAVPGGRVLAGSARRPAADSFGDMTNEANPAPSHRRALLWSAVVVSAAVNAITSIAGLSPYISIAFGAATFMCGMALFAGRREKR